MEKIMKKYLKITRPSMGNDWYISDLETAIHELKNLYELDEVNDTLCFELLELDEDVVSALHEFQGW